jgi:hypothetical protein
MVCPNCGTDASQCECALPDVRQSRAVTPAATSPVDLSLAASWPDEAPPASGADDDRAALLQFLRDFTSSAPAAERPPPATPKPRERASTGDRSTTGRRRLRQGQLRWPEQHNGPSRSVVPLWISISQSLASNGYIALPRNFAAQASAGSELVKTLERVKFPTQDVVPAAGFESTLHEYIGELELIIPNGSPPGASGTLGQLQSRLATATRLLRKALGMSGTYNCQFANPMATASPSVALHIYRFGVMSPA